MELPFLVTLEKELGLFEHTYPNIKREGKGKGQRTNKQDEDQIRPATHNSPNGT